MSGKYELISNESGGTLIKSWTQGVAFENEAREQLKNIASLPFIYKWVAAMPDVHLGIGATVGSVIPTKGAVIPAAVGVDIGCGMMAQKLSLNARDLPDSLKDIRNQIERDVPVGREGHSKRIPPESTLAWAQLEAQYRDLTERYPRLKHKEAYQQLGSLGSGNHFIEICLDENQDVWIMLHSGSRGPGNIFGRFFIELAKRDMEKHLKQLPDANLAYFSEGTEHFGEYIEAVQWAQNYARLNREIMMALVLKGLRHVKKLPEFKLGETAVNCHHNYVEVENHYGEDIYVTRKGAVRARRGDLGIIPGSMGAKSFIVRGLGNEESFQSCSHGAGRMMSRTHARKTISLEEHRRDTENVECRKDEGVIDESPRAYKDIDSVMNAQSDLVEVVHTLKQVVCVKG